MIELKKCTKCKEQKEIIHFGKSKAGKNGLFPKCKECVRIISNNKETKEYQKQYRLSNRDKMKEYKKEYRKINLEKLCEKSKIMRETESYKEYMKEFRTKNKDHIVEYCKKYYELNKEEILEKRKEYHKQYYLKNKEKISAKARERNKTENSKNKRNAYKKNRRKSDNSFRLAANISGRIRKALKGNLKSKRTRELIGCTIEELKLHIEKQFRDGMTWENYSFETWHIDHIRPCASFDLSDPEQQKICFNYKNMQPLWAYENLSKNDKYDLN